MESTQYRTRAFRTGSFGLAIALIVMGSMAFLWILIVLGTPPLVSTAALLGCITLGVGWLGGDAVYRIDDQGLEREVTSLLTKRTKRTRFGWDQVDSYKTGRDIDRSWGEYEFLEVRFRQRGQSWKLADQSDPAAFVAFRQAFEAGARQADRDPAEAPVRRRASFFETPWAKLVTLLSYLVLIGLGLAWLTGDSSFSVSHLVRLVLVILPGVAYLTYRVFLRPERRAP